MNWRGYYQLIKPRITFSNLITTFIGVWLASKGFLEWAKVAWTLAGTSMIVSSGAALNNFIDRELDKKMERTKRRILPTGQMKPNVALVIGMVLLAIGIFILVLKVNWISALLGLIGHVFYVLIYTPLKRVTTLNTMIGGISGAVPPVIGYVSVTNHLDLTAWVLFALLFLWQPPHFLALAIFKADDYRRGMLQMLPVIKGNKVTKRQMFLWGILLWPATLLLFFIGGVGLLYVTVNFVLGLIYIILLLLGFTTKDDMKWAKRLFAYSIIYLCVFCTSIIADSWF